MSLRIDGNLGGIQFPQNNGPKKTGKPVNAKPLEFPKYLPPKRELTPAQKQYEDAQKTMVDIEKKYDPKRDPMLAVLITTPFDPSQCSPEDKKAYLNAKKLVDKVSDAQKKIIEIEVKYQPNRDPKLAVYHTKPFDTSQCSAEDKKAYDAAQKIVKTYIPEPPKGPTPYMDVQQ